ncbi:MAG: hypothetical protein ACXVB9_21455 [Bdellovibrionota bacterium]
MGFPGRVVFCAVLLSSCAASRHVVLVECDRGTSLTRGIQDGASGHKARFGFTHSCTPETRALAVSAYTEGFEASRPRRAHIVKEEEVTPEAEAEEVGTLDPAVPVPSTVRAPSTVQWECEIEANSKVFTGSGITRDEALGSARATCGSHYQAQYCTKSDCKQTL